MRNILVFVKIAELGSVRLAAEAAGMAQPSASQSLAELESLLESPLFLRHARGMTLTMVGRTLLPMAHRLLDVIDESADRVASLQGSTQGIVRVGAIAAAMHGVLLEAMPCFSRENPEVMVHLEEMEGKRQMEHIANGDLDLCLCRNPGILPEGWRFEPLVADRFTIACDPSHPLSGNSTVSMEQLAAETWLTVPVSMIARRSLDQLFDREPNFPAIFNLVATAPALITQLLKTQRLLSLLPERLVWREIRSGLIAEVPMPIDLPLHEIGMLIPETESAPALQKLTTFLLKFTVDC